MMASHSAEAEEAPLVFIVDDDEEVRTAISELMLSVGIEAECCASTRDLIDSPLLDRAGLIDAAAILMRDDVRERPAARIEPAVGGSKRENRRGHG